MSHLSNYPPGVTGWDIDILTNGHYREESESLCSECGKPCDESTCKLCLEGIAEMAALEDSPLDDFWDFVGAWVFALAVVVVMAVLL